MTFIIVGISLPFLALFLYCAIYPEETALFGERWKYKNQDLEPSDELIRFNRICSIVCFVVLLLIITFAILGYL